MSNPHVVELHILCLFCCPSQDVSPCQDVSLCLEPPWIPALTGMNPLALPDAGHQLPQMRILTHFCELMQRIQVRPKGGRWLPGDKTREKDFNSWWIPASKIRSFEVLEFPSLIMYFLADILFIVITVVPFGISSIFKAKRLCLKS